jgi:very-short-patch-repair endonuclease
LCPDTESFAKTLRKRSTDAENLLWKHIRAKRLQGLKFRRQEPIGKYIVDFVCYERRVIIELDGGQHNVDIDKDEERALWLKNRGFKILRFWNNDVLKKIEEILEVILKEC